MRVSPKKNKPTKKYPEIHIDRKNGFTSIKLASGIEKKSYLKKGFVFLENSRGKVIEIQTLNQKDSRGKK